MYSNTKMQEEYLRETSNSITNMRCFEILEAVYGLKPYLQHQQRQKLCNYLDQELKVKIKPNLRSSDINSLYEKAKKLQKNDPERSLAFIQTNAEHSYLNLIRKFTKKDISRSHKIGRYVADLFSHSYSEYDESRGVTLQGLVIEINGMVHHDSIAKIRKDDAREAVFAKLGIAVKKLNNWDLLSPKTMKVIEGIRDSKPLNSRNKKRLKTRLEMFTLICSMSETNLEKLFGIGRKTLGTHTYDEILSKALTTRAVKVTLPKINTK
jgi:very-short-patch-repair endonuclease